MRHTDERIQQALTEPYGRDEDYRVLAETVEDYREVLERLSRADGITEPTFKHPYLIAHAALQDTKEPA